MQTTIRSPAVAGMFYPGNPTTLAADVRHFLAAAPRGEESLPPKAIIAPHAGYVYSGATAASVYARLLPWRQGISRVVLLGPSHRVPLEGLALPTVEFFATPLGDVAIDRLGIEAVKELPQVVFSDPAHAWEHSLEVQLPFLQTLLDDFKLIPFAVGSAAPEAVAEVLERLWGGPETLFVVSSDLSHYLAYAAAGQIDRNTCNHVLGLRPDLRPDQACGAHPINGLLVAARRHGLRPEMVQLCNSGDTAGDKARVVGYGAFAFYQREDAPHG